MKISELTDCPQWLKEARTENADVEIKNGCVVWRGGEWQRGVWYGGMWQGGEWQGGVWRDGEWQGGEWQGGEWWGGMWQGGVWRDGWWQGGVWRGGVWWGGMWWGGVWRGGVWQRGVWHGTENRMDYMLSMLGIVGEDCIAYRTTKADGSGRHTEGFTQPEGEYCESDLPPAGSGTCVKGIHVTTAARAWTYFGIDETCQFWRVRFKRSDILDCDGEKLRISGGFFEKIARPF